MSGAMLAPLPTPMAELSLTLDPKPISHFGRGRVSEVGAVAASLGSKSALIVTDPFLATSYIVAAVRASLEAAGIVVAVYGDVTPNPTTINLNDGSDLAVSVHADAIVAVGGGSSLDAAKGIAIGAVNPERGMHLDCSTLFANEALPIVAVPTTSGTGAEVNAFGVITDVVGHRKFYVGHESALAKAAILDPELTVGLPAFATAATGFDALTHALESYLSIRANPYSDGIALQTISTVATYLPRAVADGTDIEARSELLFASHVVGVGFSHTGLGLVHGVAHPLGGQFNIPHGFALALVMRAVLRFNRQHREDRLARVGFALGVADTNASEAVNADAAVERICSLAVEVGLGGSLSQFGVTESALESLARDTLADAVTANNPVFPTFEDVLSVLKESL
ncbi:Alcohol dehydrogenase [Leifsonia rubra CMS 76R]|uniref:Alcohol dehydrogenase n=1 Tax=Rhodoglobus vestalii TaxID=193384 RepID=A0A8H2PTI4_9MICO|nr:iron-containing alcohol dehydrogenase [Rhodoglobus vestalii]EPR76064.1 Alcohol dehydrogenase [Leifsonia rubra CMS 76R]TQO18547.1 alcohol dehydrogenase [Rhodoglobus vestalii]